jgi:hypothetical protein
MNIQQAKLIPLERVVQHLGGRFSHKGSVTHETWWYSPFRPEEKTASFKIDQKTNKWHDFARTEKRDAHGDILDLWADYHNLSRKDGAAIKNALQALRAFAEAPPHLQYPVTHIGRNQTCKQAAPSWKPERYKIIKPPGRIWIDSLKQEIARRGLSLATVQPHLKQAYILDTKTSKTYNGFAFENDKGGYEISIPNPRKCETFKTTVKPKGITTFVPDRCKAVSVFEGFWDFYTWVQMNKGLEEQGYIILNSTTNSKQATDYLIARKNIIKCVLLFMDNDPTGEKALSDMALSLEPQGFAIGAMNHLYEEYKDLSDSIKPKYA